MDHENATEARPGKPHRGLFVAAAAAAAAIWIGLSAWQGSPSRRVQPIDSTAPNANSLAGVKYIGDAACTRCHGEIAATYRRHPMGQSLAPVTDAFAPAADPGKGGSFEFKGLVYSVEHQDNRLIHKETRRDPTGRVIAQTQAEIQYVVGSGRQGYSYLIERDGFLFQSPITWYSKEKRWGLAPNYENRNYHFDRPIIAECLFCHANQAERVTSAINRYKTPVFRGHAIGCERCHGPGELHVERQRGGDLKDTTIVNPARLEPSRRDAVCEQCHLIGPTRIARIDSRSEDFQPGLEFYRFWSVFVAPEGSPPNKFAGQVEQMHESRCFRASDGRLGCISCHDPHVMPPPEQKAAYFRARCLECHSENDCQVPANMKIAANDPGDCIHCHMPRSESSNNPHVATTNHRIPRRLVEVVDPGATPPAGQRALPSLVNFHHKAMDAKDLLASERERGMALCRLGGTGAAREALPLLEAAIAARPDDLFALESYAEVLGRLSRQQEGLAAYKRVLARDPTRQTALEGAAHLASQAGRHQDAAEFWNRAVAVNPWRSDYYAGLAAAALSTRDWSTGADACQKALRLNPSLLDVRKWLVQCDLRLGNRDAARSELETLLGFDPPDRADILRRFSSLVPTR